MFIEDLLKFILHGKKIKRFSCEYEI